MTNYEKYRENKDAFFKCHKHAFECETSPMIDDVYHKTYYFDDGAIWYERMAPTWRTASATVTVEGIAVKIEKDIKLFECEYFSSDYSKSGKYYEKW